MLFKLQDCIYRMLHGLIGYGARLLFLLLCIATLLIQAVVYLPYKEWVGLSWSDGWTGLAVLLVCALFYFFCTLLVRLSNRQLFLLFSVLYLLVGFILLFCLPSQLRDDASSVFRAARALNEGNVIDLQAGAYLYRYPHQLGLVTLERLVLFVFPMAGAQLFFYLNILAIIGINYANWKLSEELFRDEQIGWYTILALFAFLPQFFNSFFVYGLTYGLCAASFGILYLWRYLQHPNLKQALLASGLLALSYWIRNNNSILLVAVVVVVCLEYLRRRKSKVLAIVVPILLFSFGLNRATIMYYERVGNITFAPNPKVTWLAMGLQDTQPELRQGGWYNKYVRRVYDRYDGDKEKIEQAAWLEIEDRTKFFAENPAYTVRFFTTKFLTTWTESTFQSIWSGPSKPRQGAIRGAMLESLYHGGRVYRFFYHYTHAYLILLYAGALLFLLVTSPWKRQPMAYYAYIYFAGGVLFHLLWETKSQYAYPYVLLLIPFAVKGYQEGREAWLRMRRKNE